MRSGIYSITSPTGAQYIGSAVYFAGRWAGHRRDLRKNQHGNFRLQKAWNKWGEAQMRFQKILICAPEMLLIYEQIALDTLRPGYNICRIAGNSFGLKRSDETRRKLSESRRGKKLSPEHRAAQSRAQMGRIVLPETREKLAAQKGWTHSEEAKTKMRGRKVSPEGREKMRQAMTGSARHTTPHSDETKARISAANKGRKLSDETRARMRADRQRRREAKL